MDKHHKHDILQPGNFVAYAGIVCKELDAHWRSYLTGTGPSIVSVDLADRNFGIQGQLNLRGIGGRAAPSSVSGAVTNASPCERAMSWCLRKTKPRPSTASTHR